MLGKENNNNKKKTQTKQNKKHHFIGNSTQPNHKCRKYFLTGGTVFIHVHIEWWALIQTIYGIYNIYTLPSKFLLLSFSLIKLLAMLKRSGSLFSTSSCKVLRATCNFFIWIWALLSVACKWCRRVKLGDCMKGKCTLL